MQLTEEQKDAVRQWIDAGAKLSEIQDRLGKEYDLRLTYMDARLLVDDLKLTPKDPVVAKPAPAPEEQVPAEASENGEPVEPDSPAEAAELPVGGGNVSVAVDQITRAGAMVSGKATFSDGKSVDWYLDQYGRFGMVPPEPGYRPSQEDLQEFQVALDRELQKLGY